MSAILFRCGIFFRFPDHAAHPDNARGRSRPAAFADSESRLRAGADIARDLPGTSDCSHIRTRLAPALLRRPPLWSQGQGQVIRRVLGSTPRVVAAVHAAQTVGHHVGVDLGRRDVGMAQHGLDRPEVRARLEQVGGEGVP